MTLNVGDKAPDFTVTSTDRDSFNLYEQLKDGPILLNFYVGDFGINCTNYMGKFIEQYARLESTGVRMVAINNDSLDSHKMFMDRLGAPFEFLHDADKTAAKDYGAIVGPGFMVTGFTNREFYLIDKDGIIRFIWRSPEPKILPEFDDIIKGIESSL